MRRTLPLILAFTTLASSAFAADPKLDGVLRQMDAASLKFQSAEASVRKEQFEKVVRDTTEQSGTIYFLRTKTGTEMGAVIGPKYIHFADGKGEMYDNVAKKTTPFSAGQDRARAESFLTLGFGGSGKDLERAWTIDMQGEETVDGTPTVKLNLVPKDPSVASTFTHILIWVDPVRSLSLKQEYFTPEGDTQTSYYTHIRYNTAVDKKKYAAPKR
jgi:hypothetical protein